jgi:TolB protein
MRILQAFAITLIVCFQVSCSKSNEPSESPSTWVTYDSYADWSPDGNEILFVRVGNSLEGRDGGLFIYDIRDSSLNPFFITSTALLLGPKFSPDGSQILYSQYRTLFILDRETDSNYQVTNDVDTYYPEWSPDGSRIAYHKVVGEERGAFIQRIGSDQRYQMPTYYERPVWYADGNHLAVISYEYEGAPQIVKVDTLGNEILKLTDTPTWKYDIDISLTTGKICFSQQYKGDHPKIWIMELDGYALRQLVKEGSSSPAFSPDGEWVVYTHTYDNDGSLWTIRVDGTEKHRITLFPLLDY